MSFVSFVPSAGSRREERRGTPIISPLVGLFGFTALVVSACTVPMYIMLRRRLVRIDETLNDIRRTSVGSRKALLENYTRDTKKLLTQIEHLQAQVDNVGKDVKGVGGSILERHETLDSMETHLKTLRYLSAPSFLAQTI